MRTMPVSGFLFAAAVLGAACDTNPTQPYKRPGSLKDGTLPVTSITITDLGILPGGSGSTSDGINDRGQVVGSSFDASGASHALLWTVTRTGVTTKDLGTPFAVNAINNRGQIVGARFVPGSCGLGAALLTVTPSGIAEQNLGTLPGGCTSAALGINAGGQIVGLATPAGAPNPSASDAALWSLSPAGVTVQDLGTLPGAAQTWATGINARGEIVGTAFGATALSNRAVLWTVTPSGVRVQQLGTLPGGSGSAAWDINDEGQVVGNSVDVSGGRHAVVWTLTRTGVSVRDLGTLPGGNSSGALAINNRRQIVGASMTASGLGHAALWTVTPSGSITVQDLGVLPGGDRSFANGINIRGQITGASTTASGAFHAALWRAAMGQEDEEEAITASHDREW